MTDDTPPASPAEQAPGMPEAKCHACGLDGAFCLKADCPNPRRRTTMADPTPPASREPLTEEDLAHARAALARQAADTRTKEEWIADAARWIADAPSDLATPPASPAATDKEVARVVKRLTSGNAGWADLCQAADLLARVARERDEQARLKHEAYDRNNSALADALQRAEAAEKVLAIANRGGLDLLYAVRKAIGWTDKHALSLLPDECARLKKAAVRNAPIWPGKDFDHSQPGGFDGPTGAD